MRRGRIDPRAYTGEWRDDTRPSSVRRGQRSISKALGLNEMPRKRETDVNSEAYMAQYFWDLLSLSRKILDIPKSPTRALMSSARRILLGLISQ
ncbi:hypothetical protein PVAP13_2KG097116 [Panicum virgatum]|uniref:Uncharacterized protein n=1 Tax=Panicum virgatum TaxID=38727 RepID=A0A8T0W753_PANVG|nr:hypothetical protein PVAP13_2KG097116 [Panicum virgatum]